jgi:hypothetical protein
MVADGVRRPVYPPKKRVSKGTHSATLIIIFSFNHKSMSSIGRSSSHFVGVIRTPISSLPS